MLNTAEDENDGAANGRWFVGAIQDKAKKT